MPAGSTKRSSCTGEPCTIGPIIRMRRTASAISQQTEALQSVDPARMRREKKHSRSERKAQFLVITGIAALVVSFPLFTWQLPSGHDAFFYHARLVEFRENI